MSAAITIYQPDRQGTGVFDGGRFTEIKPNPHRAFEIMSYVLKGELGHYPTLGTKSRVKEVVRAIEESLPRLGESRKKRPAIAGRLVVGTNRFRAQPQVMRVLATFAVGTPLLLIVTWSVV